LSDQADQSSISDGVMSFLEQCIPGFPALNNALAYFGGVPRNILSDNMAQVVTRPSRYEPVFTALIEQWAVHYRTNMQATRVAKPKDKASIENSVHIV